MKNFIFCTLTAFILLSGCCHKRYCEGFSGIFWVDLYNFDDSDVDSISIEVFQTINNNTKVRIDSSFTWASGSLGVSRFYFQNGLTQGNEYKLTLTSKNLGQIYLISNFTTRTQSCNNCVIKSMNDDYVDLYSYDLNAQPQYYSDIRIYK